MISNRHLHLHCVVYDEDITLGIPPLVYAQNLSRNGTYFRSACGRIDDSESSLGRLVDRNSEPILLDDGDELWMGPNLCLKYHSLAKPETTAIDRVQELEKQVHETRLVHRTIHYSLYT